MEPGAVVAERYRIERLLGRGGMGEVWAATHLITGKRVALKLLRPREDQEGARRRVLREARAACAVQHPAVVPVHDVVEAEDGAPALVMDLLEGEPLRARLAREGTLPVAEARRIAAEVLEALAAAHAAGIVHRDLKPENLFLLPDGQVRILDFGVAKLLAGEGQPSATTGTLTAEGAMIGTPFYMAPEQAFGDPIDGRADLWAVGIVLFECLAGEPPTRGENLGQVLRILSTGKIPPLRERAQVPEALGALVDALLRIDPAERPASAGEALAALRGAAEVPAPKVPARARRWPWIAASAVAAALAVAAWRGTRAPVVTAIAPVATATSAAASVVTAAASAPPVIGTASAAPSSSAPRPSRAAPRPAPPPATSSSAAAPPRLLTDVPF